MTSEEQPIFETWHFMIDYHSFFIPYPEYKKWVKKYVEKYGEKDFLSHMVYEQKIQSIFWQQ